MPILALTFHSARYDHLTLRRLVAEVDDAVKAVPLVAETTIIGGARRQVRVLLDPVRLASRNLSAAGLVPMLQQANRQYRSGGLTTNNQEFVIETGAFLTSAEDVGNVVVGVFGGRPVYLREVAKIVDGAEEPSNYTFLLDHGSRRARDRRARAPSEEPAVTLSIAKRPGANAISVAHEVLRKIETLKGTLIPRDVEVSITRNYGETAAEKSNELLFHMGIAVIGVSLLIWLTLGWRESMHRRASPSRPRSRSRCSFFTCSASRSIASRSSRSSSPSASWSMTRSWWWKTSSAIFICRQNKGRNWAAIAVEAVNEVGNPTILATFAVIAAVLPMAFVGGLMGPYMRPIPIGASAAMVWSLAIAFIVTPWASIRILALGQKVFAPDRRRPRPPARTATSRTRRISSPGSIGA